jgi:hypothetical protein
MSQQAMFNRKQWVSQRYTDVEIIAKLFDIESIYLRPHVDPGIYKDVEFLLTLINEMYTPN